MQVLNGIYLLDADAFDLAYGPDERAAIAGLVRVADRHFTRDAVAADPGVLADVDFVFGGWGMPVVGRAFLDAAPRLKAIFYAAGAVGGWMTEAVAERGVVVSTAQEANSVPVAEYTLAMIILGLKQALPLARQTRAGGPVPDRNRVAGAYGSTVGLVSYGQTARLLRNLLRPFDVHVIVYDPFLTARTAAEEGVERASLDAVFALSDVVSLHTPLLPETVGLITGQHIASMRLGSTFINTARGPVVREEEMLDVLERRPDLQAILDVAAVEPPLPKSRIYTLTNVLHTPHVAGSAGPECRRLGRHMADELARYLKGEPLKSAIDFGRINYTSNRFARVASVAPSYTSRSPDPGTAF